MRNVTDSRSRASGEFQRVVAAFLTQPGLPFASVLSVERIERVFTKHGNLFGMNAVYSTAVMVWSFLSQVLRDGKEASCQAAVARVVGGLLQFLHDFAAQFLQRLLGKLGASSAVVTSI